VVSPPGLVITLGGGGELFLRTGGLPRDVNGPVVQSKTFSTRFCRDSELSRRWPGDRLRSDSTTAAGSRRRPLGGALISTCAIRIIEAVRFGIRILGVGGEYREEDATECEIERTLRPPTLSPAPTLSSPSPPIPPDMVSSEKYAGKLALFLFRFFVLEGEEEVNAILVLSLSRSLPLSVPFGRSAAGLFPDPSESPSSSFSDVALEGKLCEPSRPLELLPVGTRLEEEPEDVLRCKSGTVEWLFVPDGLRV
jgi:hypothetical protein